MMIIALVALFCLNIGTPGEAQEVDNANSEQRLPTSDLLMYLRELRNTKETGMDDHDQRAKKSQTFSDYGQDMKLKGTSDISTVPQSRVKRHRHSLGQQNYYRLGKRGCPLTTCQTHNLANWLYLIAASKGKDSTAPKNTSDPHGYGKKRRRRSTFLPGYSTKIAQ
ncbi:ADM-like [Amblyraja radiata]|uniref:ADM-like n=1 Tax=Amblyraja radiata TaxID=386614 RepID=UPI0014021344|nr:ADM-like [Amblyraja radiata]